MLCVDYCIFSVLNKFAGEQHSSIHIMLQVNSLTKLNAALQHYTAMKTQTKCMYVLFHSAS